MTIYENNEIWFVTGAQLLYGGETVKIVDSHSQAIVNGLNESGRLPMNVVYKGTANSAAEVAEVFAKANVDPRCVGVIAWMHTFSPAKMWIHGLKSFQKPLLHLHTQFNREIPWADIDMDYMNLNQSAHGDREFGHIVSRLRINRKVVVGFWQEESTAAQVASWMRVCAAWADQQNLKVVRFGDNMNNVAVTDGDKVEAEKVLGYHVDYYPIGDLAAVQADVTDAQIADLIAQYEDQYELAPNAQIDGADRNQVVEAAREELAIRQFLADKGAFAFTTNFDALHGMNQLPGLASQRLMAEGYGFGAEGDWKTAALVRLFKVMTKGLKNGSSFLEDYVLDFPGDGAILQAHMLEVCPTIASKKPRLEVHPLGIGGKADPARLVFTAHPGTGVAATIIDLGSRFRMIVNKVQVLEPKAPLPKLPVASAFWKPEPNLSVGAASWILAGGTHHTAFSYDISIDQIADYADIADIELVVIDESTTTRQIKRDLTLNDVAYMLKGALK